MTREYRAYLFAIGCIVLAGAGITLLTLPGASVGDTVGRWRLILGWSMLIWGVAFLAFFLLSQWAYGSMRRIMRERPQAVVVRSGASPAFRRALDDSSELRRHLARTRPPFMQFLVVFDTHGLDIRHGSGAASLTGSLERTAIRRVSLGRTLDGIWPFATVEVDVALGDGNVTVPFVVRGPTGFLGARKAEVARVVRRVDDLYASLQG